MGATTPSYVINKGMRHRIRTFGLKQAKVIDYSLDLDYAKEIRHVIQGDSAGPWAGITDFEGTYFWNESRADYGWAFGSGGLSTSPPSYGAYDLAYAKAYGKFIDKVYRDIERAELLTALAEGYETYGMVFTRMKQLYDGGSALKQGKFREFLRIFGISAKKQHRNKVWSRPRQFSSLWLEYWMGWAPVVGDIMAGLEQIMFNMPDNTFIAKGAAQKPINPDPTYATVTGNGYKCWQFDSGTVLVRISGKLRVEDSNTVLLNRLGLLNPIATGYDLIPFSWFAGWFNNLGQVFRQMTDLLGISLVSATVSCKAQWTHDYHLTYNGSFGVNKTVVTTSYARKKFASLPKVKLVWRIPSHLSPSRGATLASLLVTLFSPK